MSTPAPTVTTTTVSAVPVTRAPGPSPVGPARWSWPAFSIGLILGLLIMVLLLWLAFLTRTVVFRYTPRSYPTCGATDYFNDPEEAVRMGGVEGEMLFASEGVLLYRRKQKNTQCVPGADQIISIPQPPVCSFTDGEGQEFMGQLESEGQYSVPTGAGVLSVKARRHCRPMGEGPFVSGRPLPHLPSSLQGE